MNIEYYDVYIDNCFYRRIHYLGLLQILVPKLKDKGHIVRVDGGYIKID